MKYLCVLASAGLALSASLTEAMETTFGNWQTGLDGSTSASMIYTNNDLGEIFAHICEFESEKCHFRVSFPLTCTEKAKSPILINGYLGSQSSVAECVRGERGVFELKDFKLVDDLVRSSGSIGFAIPEGKSGFSVVEFLTHDSKRALNFNTSQITFHKVASKAWEEHCRSSGGC
ncbi:hypothetical protein [Microbulbifer elongatus]|uniref:hypothetical protein n=1 Tax=Microbulbifer elongatus TaxID=86173 RepID=UPI001CFC94A1|nr:hypothetical protein [Microbulbifer elongatus]